MKKKFSWRIIFNIFVAILTVAMVVYFCFSEGGLIDLIKSSEQINVFWLCIAIVFHLLNIFLDMMLIYVFIKDSSPHFKIGQAFKVSMAGQFFCAITPSSMGGQPMQIVMLSTMNVSTGKATSALIQKFLVWQFVLMAYSIFAVCARFSLLIDSMDPGIWVLAIIGFLAQCVVCAALLLASFAKNFTKKLVGFIFRFLSKIHIIKNPEEKRQNLENQINAFHECNRNLYKNKKLVIKTFMITILQMTVFFLVPYFVGLALSPKAANMFDMLCAQAFVNMVSSLMPLPGGSGAAELCFATFFSEYFTSNTMKSAILIWRTITYYGTIFISAPFSGISKKKKEEQKIESNVS